VSGLEHVVWLGGGAGAGKTTVARCLARRRGLRIYSADNWTWDHRDRALAVGSAAAIRWEALSPAERTAAPIEEQLAMALLDERGPMVVEDLCSLPRSPVIVAEGTVLPAAVADPARSVWLLPTPAFQARHRVDELQRHLLGLIAEDAHGHGIATISIDGSRSVGAIVDEVEEVLLDPLNDGPVASSRDELRALLREASLAAVHQVQSGCARPWATNDPTTLVRSFACECGSPDCDVDVMLAAGVAAEGPVLAPGHHV
jgi:hypothetical protein